MSDQVECTDCGEVFADSEGGERLPCPRCGGSRRTISLGASLTATSHLAGTLGVDRGVNDARIGTLLGLLAMALASASFADSALPRLALALAGFAGAATLLWIVTHVPPVRRRAMRFIHFLTRR